MLFESSVDPGLLLFAILICLRRSASFSNSRRFKSCSSLSYLSRPILSSILSRSFERRISFFLSSIFFFSSRSRSETEFSFTLLYCFPRTLTWLDFPKLRLLGPTAPNCYKLAWDTEETCDPNLKWEPGRWSSEDVDFVTSLCLK